MWVVGSLATTRLGWDRSRSPPPHPIHLPHHYLLPLRRRADCIATTFRQRSYSWPGSAGHPRRACWSPTAGVRSICSPTEKEAVRNKQTDRQVGRTQKNPTAASQHAACIPVTYYPFIYLNLPPLTLWLHAWPPSPLKVLCGCN